MDHKTKEILSLITPECKKVMETIHFCADLHHSHPKIVNICNRPVYIDHKIFDEFYQIHADDPEYDIYKDKKFLWDYVDPAHTEWLIREVFNKWVQKKHTVFILGDLTFARHAEAERFLDRLNGNKFMILGNHDKNIDKSTRFSQITQIKDFNFSLKDFNIHVNLCHYPILEWNRQFHGSWHLYGHSHCRPLNYLNELAFDVGIDRKNWWRPYNLYQICYVMHYIELGKPDDEIIEELLKMEI